MRRPSIFLLPIIYLGFISLGLPDGTLGVAWPAIYPELRLPIGLAGTIMIVVTLLSGVSGFSSGPVVARFRTGPVVLASCLLTGGALLLISRAGGIGWMLLAAVPLGLGAGAVDAALNGFVARHYSGRHMNWLHACWGIGATSGPLFMGWAIGAGHGWRAGYLAIGLAQVSLALLFLLTLPLWATVPERTSAASSTGRAGPEPAAAAHSLAGWLSPVIFALYVAVEMTAGLWAASILMVGRHFPAATAAACTAGFYGSITGGRVLVGFVVERFGNRRLVAVGLAAALAGAVLFSVAHAVPLTAVALVLLGAGFAPVYPCLMHEVPRRFAPDAVQTVIGRQSGAANLGAAILPAAAGGIAQYSLQGIPWTLVAGILVLGASVRWLNRLT